MFAKVSSNANMRKTLQYNNQKVSQGKAEIIHAGNFIQNANELSKKDMWERFDQRTSLNWRVKQNVVHISIGFRHTDTLSNEKMKSLAEQYMERIGFGEQPYLVYRHHDVTQPHMHIVATNIGVDGKRIDLGEVVLWKSRQTANALSEEFSLAPSEKASIRQKSEFEVKQAQAVEYGKSPTIRAISDVLNTVLEHYKYDSFGSLTAALKEYNVTINTGKESSHLHKVGGLMYQALNEHGRRIGAPIKASIFHLKPTLKYLEKKISENSTLMEGYRQRIETAVDWALAGGSTSWDKFRQSLEREGISTVVQRSGKDEPEQVYFVDHREKAAFSGESLGNQYTLTSLHEKCTLTIDLEERQIHRHHLQVHL